MGNTYDPRWITPKFGRCCACGADLTKQTEVKAFYFPRTKNIFCTECGANEERRFTSWKSGDNDINQYLNERR